MISRRDALRVGAVSSCFGLSLPAAATPFWNRKPPVDWSSEEIIELTTRSPWARETNVDFEAAEGGHFEAPGSGAPYGGSDGGGRGATVERPAGVLKKAPVLVRWESAQPVRDALLTPLPKGFEEHYVLSVSNIPAEAMNPEKRRSVLTPPLTLDTFLGELQAAATLEVPGKEPAGAGIAQKLKGSDSTYLFGFSKELVPLTVADKEALFTLHAARVSVKAKFLLKDMLYRGKLAL